MGIWRQSSELTLQILGRAKARLEKKETPFSHYDSPETSVFACGIFQQDTKEYVPKSEFSGSQKRG